MGVRTRHPCLSAVACRVYSLMIRLYPAEFRRAFGHELIVTFRNQAEDALNGDVLTWLLFAGRIAGDWVRTWSTLTIESETPATVSLLGLRSDADHPWGCIDTATVDISFVFAAAGVVLMVVGWYRYVATLAFYLGCRR
jgi:hypothetical protein